MLKFENDTLMQMSVEEAQAVIPKIEDDGDWTPRFTEVGFTESQMFGNEHGVQIQLLRRKEEAIFDVWTGDGGLHTIYCPNELASAQCLIKLAPVLSLALSFAWTTDLADILMRILKAVERQ